MNTKTGYSVKNTVEEVVADIKGQFANFNTKMVLFFASVKFDPQKIAQQMNDTFKDAVVFGCSTAGEIVSGKMLKESVVAMAFNPDAINDVKVELVENIKDPDNVNKAFKGFEDYYKVSMADMDFNKYIGIVLADGLSKSEEIMMDRMGDLTNILFIGGSAGDDLKFTETYVYANGKSYTNAAILALLKPTKGYDIIKTQSFKPCDVKLTATKVNTEDREVIEFNNEPAAVAYSQAVGCKVEDVSNHFMSKPVGVVIDNDPYVRSPQQLKGNSVVFYCNILEGMELSLLESTDIVKDTKEALDSKIKELGGSVSGIINFHCILRTLELYQKKQDEAYGKVFENVPTVGFSTYGEQYLGHINQTSTMIVIK